MLYSFARFDFWVFFYLHRHNVSVWGWNTDKMWDCAALLLSYFVNLIKKVCVLRINLISKDYWINYELQSSSVIHENLYLLWYRSTKEIFWSITTILNYKYVIHTFTEYVIRTKRIEINILEIKSRELTLQE